MKKPSTSIILTGLVRDPEKLINKLDQFDNWQKRNFVNQVVISTWIGELDKYPELRKSLSKYNIRVIEIEEPRLILKGGHQLHQMLALDYGLAAIANKDDYILKTRVDLADNIEEMTWEFEKGTEIVDDFLGVGIERKIVVEYAQLLFPFLLGDAQFFGTWKTIKKLVNLSTEMELQFARVAVEQSFFFNPFRDVEFFRRHFYWNLPHIADQQIRRQKQISSIKESTYFRQVIFAWLLILESYFKIGWGEQDPQFEAKKLDFELGDDSTSLTLGPDGSFLITKSSEVSDLLKSLTTDQRTNLVVLLQSNFGGPLNVDDDVYSELERFRLNFSTLNSARCSTAHEANVEIKGPVQHFFVSEDDSAITRYRDQVTYLRRENDALQRQLGTTAKPSFIHHLVTTTIPQAKLENLRRNHPKLFGVYQRFFWWK